MDQQANPQGPDYNQGQTVSHKIHLFNSDDLVLAFFNQVCKTDPPLVVAYTGRPAGDSSQTLLDFERRLPECPVVNLGFTEVDYTSEESDG